MSKASQNGGAVVAPQPLPAGTPTPAYFGADDQRLFGWYHAPSSAEVRDCVVVLCPMLGAETNGSNRALRHWANRLAASGVAAVRFDYHGTGDSPGRDDATQRVPAWIASVSDAAEFARRMSGRSRVVLAGLRVGATFALEAALEQGDIDLLILWAAMPTGKAYLREGRAFSRLMAPEAAAGVGAVNDSGNEQIGGFVLSGETVAGLTALDPLAGGRCINARALVIPRDAESRDATFIQRLAAAGIQTDRVVVGGYEAMMADAHESVVPDAVIDSSIAWIAEQCPMTSGAHDRYSAPHATQMVSLPTSVPDELQGSAQLSDGLVEKPMHFGRHGGLFGVLSRPAGDARRRTGVLLLNSGSVYRVGPNRLYVNLAREWASLGYTVLRMDIGGIGDSAAAADAQENHPYPARVVADVEMGIGALRAEGAERVVVAGLCSGAHATFHAGLELDGLDGLLMINPIVFYWKPSDSLDVGTWRTYSESRHYKQSVRRWRSWLRLFQGQVNIPYIARIGVTRGREIVRARYASVSRRFSGGTPELENPAHDLERLTSKGTEVLLLFSRGDPGHDFLRLNYRRELRKLQRLDLFDLELVDNADHTFTSADARRRATGALTQHLLARHP